MATDRYQRGLDRMMELVSAGHSNTFDHVKLVESYKSLDPDLSDYIVSFAFPWPARVQAAAPGLGDRGDIARGALSGSDSAAAGARSCLGGSDIQAHPLPD